MFSIILLRFVNIKTNKEVYLLCLQQTMIETKHSVISAQNKTVGKKIHPIMEISFFNKIPNDWKIMERGGFIKVLS